MLTSPKEVEAYILEKGWADGRDPLCIEALSGGVSNQVWKITGSNGRWVMKQALAKLKVKEDWFSDVRRVERERTAMQQLKPLMPKGAVPEVLYSDDEVHTYVMTCAPEAAIPWKQQLMQGFFEPQVASNAGKLLKIMQNSSAKNSDRMKAEFEDIRFFEELRIQPFYEHVGRAYGDLETPINLLIQSLRKQGRSLVHGDYSPKNMLVTPDHQIVLLDYEVSHWGQPLFDWAFCTAHLMLKGFALQRPDDSFQLIQAFLEHCDWDLNGYLPHLGLLLLARMDGKSPVEYIVDPDLKDRVRAIGTRWVNLAADQHHRTKQEILEKIKDAVEEGAANT